jgi:hypothetical protein
MNLTLIVLMSEIGGEGWVGLGFGSSMLTSEIALVMLSRSAGATVADVSAQDGYAAPSVYEGVGRFSLSADVLSVATGIRRITILRTLSSFAAGVAYFANGPVPIVHAWHSGLELAYHDHNRM